MKIAKLSLSLVFMISSCGQERSGNQNDLLSNLAGSWQSECSSSLHLSTNSGEITFWSFLASGGFDHTVIQYKDSLCTSGNESLVLSGSGSYSLGEKLDDNSAQNIQFSFDDFTATPKSSEIADDFSDQNVCDESRWSINTSKSLFGKTCSNNSSRTPEIFPGSAPIPDIADIFNQRRLWFGKKSQPYSLEIPSVLSQTEFSKI
jgi:hypothetical protein